MGERDCETARGLNASVLRRLFCPLSVPAAAEIRSSHKGIRAALRGINI